MLKIKAYHGEKAKESYVKWFKDLWSGTDETLEFELDEKATVDDLKKQILEKFRNKEKKSEAEFNLKKVILFSPDPDDGVDDVDAKVESSSTTISQVFGKKDVIEIEYVIDPEGDFEITSEGKNRQLLVGRFKYPLEQGTPSFIDLHSATLDEFPVTLKVVFQPIEKNKKLFVKEYLIDKCEKGEPAKITIKENGHVQVKDKNDQELYTKTDNDSRQIEFQEDTAVPGCGRYYRIQNSEIRPFKVDEFNRSKNLENFWLDKDVIENALHSCIASYKASPNTYLNQIGDRFGDNEKIQDMNLNGKKVAMAMVDTTLYVAFEGTFDVKDMLDDLSIEMVNDEDYWSDCKDVKFHSGFLNRAKEGIKLVKSTLNSLQTKPKKIILCGHSLGAAISALVYLLLTKDKTGENNDFEFFNVTFALPMFGNMALKYWYEENSLKFGKSMFHFVYEEDVVPASLYANYAFNQLNAAFKMGFKCFNHGFITNFIGKLLFQYSVEATKEQVDELTDNFQTMEQILEEKTKRHADQGEDQPFYFGKGVYVPIGQYLLLKNDEKDGKIQLYELGENPEIVGEQLSQSLVMLSKLGVTNAFSISNKVIGDHTIGGGKDAQLWRFDDYTKKLINKNDDWKHSNEKWEMVMSWADEDFGRISAKINNDTKVLGLKEKNFLSKIGIAIGDNNDIILEDSVLADEDQLWKKMPGGENNYFKLKNKKYPNKFLTASNSKKLTVEDEIEKASGYKEKIMSLPWMKSKSVLDNIRKPQGMKRESTMPIEIPNAKVTRNI